jgi:hypothetical protein
LLWLSIDLFAGVLTAKHEVNYPPKGIAVVNASLAKNSFMEVLAPTLGALACESTVEHYGFHDRDHFDHSRFYYEDPYDGKGNSLPGGR